MSNENVAINALLAFFNLIVKCFELRKVAVESKCAEQKQEIAGLKGDKSALQGDKSALQKERNELEKSEKELKALDGALEYLNGLSDNERIEMVVNTMQEIINDPKAQENGLINGNRQITQEGWNELTNRITNKVLDSQGLDEKQKESIRAKVHEASKKAVQISMKNIHEVTPETYQKLVEINQNNGKDDQFFSRDNIEKTINNLRAEGDPNMLKELFVIQDKLTKGEPVTFNDKTVQSDLIPARVANEHTQ